MSSFFFLVFFISIPAFLLGMIVPAVFSRFFKNGVTRKKIAKLFGAIMFGSLFASIATATPIEPKSNENIQEIQEEPASTSNPATNAPIVASEPSIEVSSKTSATVIRVVDGDTVKVDIDGVQETIRIIGINTPETVDPRKPVECFGQEASARAHALLDNQTVALEADSTQGEHDKYDRLLRYVFLSNGSDFGKQMISEGYAYEYTYSTPYTHQQDYETAQSEAENAKRGLWADNACNTTQTEPTSSSSSPSTSSSSSPSATATTTAAIPATQSASSSATTAIVSEPTTSDSTQNSAPTPAPTPEPEPVLASEPTPEPAPTPAASPACSCSANIYNCGDFSTHAAAQSVYNCCIAQAGTDIHRLDGNDNDGLVCESLL